MSPLHPTTSLPRPSEHQQEDTGKNSFSALALSAHQLLCLSSPFSKQSTVCIPLKGQLSQSKENLEALEELILEDLFHPFSLFPQEI